VHLRGRLKCVLRRRRPAPSHAPGVGGRARSPHAVPARRRLAGPRRCGPGALLQCMRSDAPALRRPALGPPRARQGGQRRARALAPPAGAAGLRVLGRRPRAGAHQAVGRVQVCQRPGNVQRQHDNKQQARPARAPRVQQPALQRPLQGAWARRVCVRPRARAGAWCPVSGIDARLRTCRALGRGRACPPPPRALTVSPCSQAPSQPRPACRRRCSAAKHACPRARTGLAELHGDDAPEPQLPVQLCNWRQAGRWPRRGAAPARTPLAGRGARRPRGPARRGRALAPPADLVAPVAGRLHHGAGHAGGRPRRAPPVQRAPCGTPAGHRPDQAASLLQRRAAPPAPPLQDRHNAVSTRLRDDPSRRPAGRTRGPVHAILQAAPLRLRAWQRGPSASRCAAYGRRADARVAAPSARACVRAPAAGAAPACAGCSLAERSARAPPRVP